LHGKQPVRTRQTGERKGSKQHLLVDGRGVPLSLIVTGAHRHEVSHLDAIIIAFLRVARKKRRRGRPPKNRRWVVEAAHSWFNRFRKLLVRYEKVPESYEALLHLAAAIICWRKVAAI
jgi:putative transposase